MKQHLLALAVASALTACGGGGNPPEKITIGIDQPPAETPRPPPTQVIVQPPVTPVPPPDENDPPPVIDEEDDEPPVTSPENPDFTAQLVRAPASGSYVCDDTVLYLTGKNIGNAELVHGNNYSTYARFSTSVDGSFAVLQFNPKQVWQNGEIKVRILAWDKPAGSPDAREIEVMSERTWVIANGVPPCFPYQGSVLPPS